MVWKAGSKGGDMLTEKEKICKKTEKSIDICRK